MLFSLWYRIRICLDDNHDQCLCINPSGPSFDRKSSLVWMGSRKDPAPVCVVLTCLCLWRNRQIQPLLYIRYSHNTTVPWACTKSGSHRSLDHLHMQRLFETFRKSRSDDRCHCLLWRGRPGFSVANTDWCLLFIVLCFIISHQIHVFCILYVLYSTLLRQWFKWYILSICLFVFVCIYIYICAVLLVILMYLTVFKMLVWFNVD